MSAIGSILSALREDEIARAVGSDHDDARERYRGHSRAVTDYRDFQRLIGDYYNHHCASCRTNGGRMSDREAQSRAKAILERQYRRRNGDIVTCYNDAHDGTNGGVRTVLDVICDALKAEAVEFYITGIFDTYVTPNAWEEKVAIIRQFIARCGVDLSASIRVDQPERYARDYRELIQAYVEGVRETSRVMRRL